MTVRVLNAGILGLGVGARNILQEMALSDRFRVYAGADSDAGARAAFANAFPDARLYPGVDELANDPDVDAVWVATPNRFHADHTISLARAGKHIVVQKPMAITLAEAETMVEAAEENRVHLVAGNSASFATPIRMIGQIVRSGELGPLRAVNVFAYHSWLLGTRMAEDLDIDQGGGVVYRAGPHQIDTVRLIAGQRLRSVRAHYGQWMPERRTPGYYAAYLEFEDGASAVAIENAYGYFVTEEMVPWDPGGEPHERPPARRAAQRKGLREGSRDETAEYLRARFRTPANGERQGYHIREWVADMGIVIASCEGGDIRQSPDGLYVYGNDGVREIRLPVASPWEAEQAELYDAIVRGRPPMHSGRSGLATLEVVLGILESSRTGREVRLSRQVPMLDDGDPKFAIQPLGVSRIA